MLRLEEAVLREGDADAPEGPLEAEFFEAGFFPADFLLVLTACQRTGHFG